MLHVPSITAFAATLLLSASLASALPAFPGAEGWGADTKGGRGGKVYIVTTTKATGAGSFREALQATGPRTIVFRVSGVIDLDPDGYDQGWYLEAKNSDVTIAGQTSPGGVTFTSSAAGSSIIMCYQGNFHDGIWRFLRFRAGADNQDAFTMNTAHHFIFDHVDFSGARDETSDATADHHFTFQWCTIANSSHGQAYGQLLAYVPTNYISLHHNLYANHVNRGGPHMHWAEEPIPEFGMIDYRNNLCYNSEAARFIDVEIIAGGELRWNLTGNYFKAGPITAAGTDHPPVRLGSTTKVYDHDNVWIAKGGTEKTAVLDRNFDNPTAMPSAWDMPAVTTATAKLAYDLVLAKVGAWPRDPMNTRTVGEVKNGTGGLAKIDDAKITSGPAAPADGDNDGMPDFWESAMGLNPASAADNILDKDNDGYTNIEEYVNDLASSLLGEPQQNPGILDVKRLAQSFPRAFGISAGRAGDRLRLALQGPGGKAAGEVVVTDIQGRKIASLKAAPELEWVSRGAGGSPLAFGSYILTWKDAGQTLARQTVRWTP